MWRRFLVLLIPAVLVGLIWCISALPGFMVGIHQGAVTQELASWKTEYSTIESRHDAMRTAEMLEYVQTYYVPGEGYRSTPDIEAALQRQRQDTIEAFVASLREYTGEDFGADSGKWLALLNTPRREQEPIQED